MYMAVQIVVLQSIDPFLFSKTQTIVSPKQMCVTL